MKKLSLPLVILLVLIQCHVVSAQWTGHSSGTDLTNSIVRSGKVGIGATSPSQFPSALLDIQSNIGIPAFRIQGGLDYSLYYFDITSFLASPGNVGYSISLKNPWGVVPNALTFLNYRVGISTNDPQETLHVNGTVGIGKISSQHAGLKIEYTENGLGSGATVFKHQRWDGHFHFKRGDGAGERTQLSFGGGGNHYMNIYDANEVVKVSLSTSGNSYFTGGNVGIGVTNPDAALTVKGVIHTNEVWIDVDEPIVPDYVFEKDYGLLSLAELEAYIKTNKHLPEVPSAKEMKANGLNLKEMNLLLLKKVEELTLHLIEVKKENETIKERLNKLENNK